VIITRVLCQRLSLNIDLVTRSLRHRHTDWNLVRQHANARYWYRISARMPVCLSLCHVMVSGVGVRLKVGDKYWEDWRGWVWGGAVPSQLRVWGLATRKKNQFCAKNYTILSKFWYLFPILQQKVGDYPQSWKWGTYPPVPPAPMPMVMVLSMPSAEPLSRNSGWLLFFGWGLISWFFLPKFRLEEFSADYRPISCWTY